MATWRLNLKRKNFKKDQEIFEFCQNHGVVGVGWCNVESESRTIIINQLENSMKSLYKEYAINDKEFKKLVRAGVSAIKMISKIEKGDFIWVNIQGLYYLCKVTRPWSERNFDTVYFEYDIVHHVEVEFRFVGELSKVPGRVINSFTGTAGSRTLQHVNDVDDVTHLIWSRFCGYEDSEVSVAKKSKNVWSVLDHEEFEEIVMLYLQIKMNYKIFTSTIKLQTKNIEGVLVDLNGNRAVLQVKNHETINALDYVDHLKTVGNVFLATTGNVLNSELNGIKVIEKGELVKFIIEYKNILRESVMYKLLLTEIYD